MYNNCTRSKNRLQSWMFVKFIYILAAKESKCICRKAIFHNLIGYMLFFM